MPQTIATAQDALRRVADLSDDEHASAEAELAAAKRSEIRLVARIEQLRAAHEQAAALRARAAALQRRMDAEMPTPIAEYEARAAEIAAVAAAMEAIDDEADAVNRLLVAGRRSGSSEALPGNVVTSHERFRSEPDVTEPDTTVTEDRWEEIDPRSGRWGGVGVYRKDPMTGEDIPMTAGARKRRITRMISGRTHKGRSLPSPLDGLKLPAARLDGPAFWPRMR